MKKLFLLLTAALLGKDTGPLRGAVVHHSIKGSFAIRQGKWKLVLCAGSGGWSPPRPGSKEEAGLPDTQLYDLSVDIGETRNVYAEHPEPVAQLTKLLEQEVAGTIRQRGPHHARPETGQRRADTNSQEAQTETGSQEIAPCQHRP